MSTLLIGTAGLALATHASPAQAQRINWEHTINLAGGKRTLIQRMAKEVMLVALQYNVRENLRNLRSNSDEFDRVLRGLHYGDLELSLSPIADPTIVEKLALVERLWPEFKRQVASMIETGAVTRNEVDIIAEINLPLLKAMDDTVHQIEQVARVGQASSLLARTVNLAGGQRTLTQKMTKELYLIALGYSAEVKRRDLNQTMEQFNLVLEGLIMGNAELLLLPAPAGPVRAQLGNVKRLWDEFRPVLEQGATRGSLDQDMLSETASLNLSLLAEMNTAVGHIVALRPRS